MRVRTADQASARAPDTAGMQPERIPYEVSGAGKKRSPGQGEARKVCGAGTGKEEEQG